MTREHSTTPATGAKCLLLRLPGNRIGDHVFGIGIAELRLDMSGIATSCQRTWFVRSARRFTGRRICRPGPAISLFPFLAQASLVILEPIARLSNFLDCAHLARRQFTENTRILTGLERARRPRLARLRAPARAKC